MYVFHANKTFRQKKQREMQRETESVRDTEKDVFCLDRCTHRHTHKSETFSPTHLCRLIFVLPSIFVHYAVGKQQFSDAATPYKPTHIYSGIYLDHDPHHKQRRKSSGEENAEGVESQMDSSHSTVASKSRHCGCKQL